MQGKRLLSVDDDDDILAIIAKVGRELGFEVETISKSTRFMTTYVRLKPDVITLDLMMPDVDGVELVRWLGDVGCASGIVILSGGHSMYVQLAQKLAFARGSLRISALAKPFKIVDLRTALIAAAASPLADGATVAAHAEGAAGRRA